MKEGGSFELENKSGSVKTGNPSHKTTWFYMVNSVTCMNVGTSLEKAIKIVLTKL